jgi:hypothetical protein
VGGLRLAGRLDRVDRLEGGGLLVLDYKTGDCRVEDWIGERPRDPQLPLYALFALPPGEALAGLAYARVKRGRFEFRGLVRAGVAPFGRLELFDESKFVETHDDWQAMLVDWRRILEGLAEAFCRGDARPEPRERQDCEACDQQPLCRLYELDERRGVFEPGEQQGMAETVWRADDE